MNEDNAHLLIVDDDERIRILLRQYLRGEGFFVSTARSVAEAESALALFKIDAMIVDIMMPEIPGTELVKKKQTPAIFLSAMGEPEDRIQGLELGAHDYLVKPFEPRELLLRIRRALSTRSIDRSLALGAFTYSLTHQTLFRGKERISLPTGEQELLRVLCAHPNVPLSREEISAAMNAHIGNLRTIDVQISRLRQKIEKNPSSPQVILSIREKGYVLKCLTEQLPNSR